MLLASLQQGGVESWEGQAKREDWGPSQMILMQFQATGGHYNG